MYMISLLSQPPWDGVSIIEPVRVSVTLFVQGHGAYPRLEPRTFAFPAFASDCATKPHKA